MQTEIDKYSMEQLYELVDYFPENDHRIALLDLIKSRLFSMVKTLTPKDAVDLEAADLSDFVLICLDDIEKYKEAARDDLSYLKWALDGDGKEHIPGEFPECG